MLPISMFVYVLYAERKEVRSLESPTNLQLSSYFFAAKLVLRGIDTDNSPPTVLEFIRSESLDRFSGIRPIDVRISRFYTFSFIVAPIVAIPLLVAIAAIWAPLETFWLMLIFAPSTAALTSLMSFLATISVARRYYSSLNRELRTQLASVHRKPESTRMHWEVAFLAFGASGLLYLGLLAAVTWI